MTGTGRFIYKRAISCFRAVQACLLHATTVLWKRFRMEVLAMLQIGHFHLNDVGDVGANHLWRAAVDAVVLEQGVNVERLPDSDANLLERDGDVDAPFRQNALHACCAPPKIAEASSDPSPPAAPAPDSEQHALCLRVHCATYRCGRTGG